MDNAPLLDIINMNQNNDSNDEYKESYDGNSLSESVGSYKSKKSKKIRRQKCKIDNDSEVVKNERSFLADFPFYLKKILQKFFTSTG